MKNTRNHKEWNEDEEEIALCGALLAEKLTDIGEGTISDVAEDIHERGWIDRSVNAIRTRISTFLHVGNSDTAPSGN